MSRYTAELSWDRGDADFASRRYSRRHQLRFDGGLQVPGSSSPSLVPEPMSDATAMDPEEAFVASIASCHLLWFLSLAAERGFCVDRYRDRPVGTLAPDVSGRLAMVEVVLHPQTDFSGSRRPSDQELDELHRDAHERCFIANSVKTAVRYELESNTTR
jgi:organic hydroperoxide reductase OsmC/OhrA